MPSIVLAALVAAAAGCHRDATVTVDVPVMTIETHVTDPGDAPRAPLRYHWRPGAVVRTESTYESSDTTPDVAVLQPTHVIDRESRVVSVDPAGVIHVRGRYLADKHLPRQGGRPVVASDRRTDRQGVAYDIWMDARGQRTAPEHVVAPAEVDRAQLGRIGALFVVLPDEPVGLGARWTAAVHGTDPDGGDVYVTLDYTLVARDAGHAELRFTSLYHRTHGTLWHDDSGQGDVDVDLTEPGARWHVEWQLRLRQHGKVIRQSVSRFDTDPRT